MSTGEIEEVKRTLARIQEAQVEGTQALQSKIHDLTLAVIGDDPKGIVGVVQRQKSQERRVKVIEWIGGGVLIFLVLSNPTFKDLFLALIK